MHHSKIGRYLLDFLIAWKNYLTQLWRVGVTHSSSSSHLTSNINLSTDRVPGSRARALNKKAKFKIYSKTIRNSIIQSTRICWQRKCSLRHQSASAGKWTVMHAKCILLNYLPIKHLLCTSLFYLSKWHHRAMLPSHQAKIRARARVTRYARHVERSPVTWRFGRR